MRDLNELKQRCLAVPNPAPRESLSEEELLRESLFEFAYEVIRGSMGVGLAPVPLAVISRVYNKRVIKVTREHNMANFIRKDPRLVCFTHSKSRARFVALREDIIDLAMTRFASHPNPLVIAEQTFFGDLHEESKVVLTDKKEIEKTEKLIAQFSPPNVSSFLDSELAMKILREKSDEAPGLGSLGEESSSGES